MKKYFIYSILSAICCFCAILQAAPTAHRPTIYIEEAENKSDVKINLSMIKPCLVNTFGHIRAINISDNIEECGYKIIPTVIGISAERIQNLLRVRSTIIINCWDLSANKIILTKKITFALIDGSLDQLQPQDIKRLFQKLYQQCVEYTAREAAIAFSEEISPVKVLAINENKIITDAPEGLYHTGNCFNVVRKINNYEQEIAIIRITEIKSKQATCNVVTLKDKNAIKAGDICRLTASKSVK
ncbi:MAG: hypothetical protein E7051_03710 [Lentisphaerae bacterium]|nr:hypothetical protein [Lentisphaerota bacterium]